MTRLSELRMLLIDDDDIDRRSLKRSFKREGIPTPIVEATNGREALQILRQEKHQSVSKFIILLDLNMPVMGGHEFLTELRQDPDLRKSIVFVLTTSDAEKDKDLAYKKNIAGYLLKHRTGREFSNTVRMLQSYMSEVELPAT